jgi:hypothetical protein
MHPEGLLKALSALPIASTSDVPGTTACEPRKLHPRGLSPDDQISDLRKSTEDKQKVLALECMEGD